MPDSERLSYAAVTPVRDDAANIARLAESLRQQTIPPEAWVIVDNGSADDTRSVVNAMKGAHPWVHLLSIDGTERASPGAPIVRAFHAGLDFLQRRSPQTDVVVKLDADVSMDPDHFEGLLSAFAADARLGITGGACYERDVDGVWRETYVTGDHVRGAVRAYRRECLAQVAPLEERVGWDTIDELKAATFGWRTRLVRTIPFYHHRPVGERDGADGQRWAAVGASAYYMGYRVSYVGMRSLFRARRDPRALHMLKAYFAAMLRREVRCKDAAVVQRLRDQQRLRSIPRRAREALGSRAGYGRL